MRYQEKRGAVESIGDFFDGLKDKKARVILDAINYDISTYSGGMCATKARLEHTHQSLFLDIQPKQNRFEALALVNNLTPEVRNFLGLWDGGKSDGSGTSYGLEAYLTILDMEIKPDQNFKVNLLKSLLR